VGKEAVDNLSPGDSPLYAKKKERVLFRVKKKERKPPPNTLGKSQHPYAKRGGGRGSGGSIWHRYQIGKKKYPLPAGQKNGVQFNLSAKGKEKRGTGFGHS